MTTTINNKDTTETAVAARLRSKTAAGAKPCLSPRASDIEFRELREARLDRIADGKSRHWQVDLRLTQLLNCIALGLSAAFIIRQNWAYWATGLAAAFAVACMWAFARAMSPREQRLRRRLACLAKRRRTCVVCGYRLHDLENHRCPECGTAFDPNDTRHLLTAETVRLYSSRARMTSAVVIVFVLFWMSGLAQRQPWPVQVGLALGLLLALQCLSAYWNRQAKRRERGDSVGIRSNTTVARARTIVPSAADKRPNTIVAPASRRCSPDRPDGATPLLPPLPHCRECGTALLTHVNQNPPETCPACKRKLTYGDVFVRPDVRRLSDPRICAIQQKSLLIRWVFLVAVCGGLTVLTQLDAGLLRAAALGRGPTMLLITLGLPLFAWVFGLAIVFRHLARRLQTHLKLLFAQIHPACSRCARDMSADSVGACCPQCARPTSEKTPAE